MEKELFLKYEQFDDINRLLKNLMRPTILATPTILADPLILFPHSGT
ncbi:hypothetical protein [Methanohalobium evestigatum]|nr:hypothetical protein [Methanohalobium evestigatum]